MTPDTVAGSARSGNSHHLDSDTCILEQRDLLCVYCSIGNQHGPRRYRRPRMERTFTELGGVGEYVDLAGTFDHHLLEPGLIELSFTNTQVSRNCIGTEECLVKRHPLQRRFRQWPDESLTELPQRPAETFDSNTISVG